MRVWSNTTSGCVASELLTLVGIDLVRQLLTWPEYLTFSRCIMSNPYTSHFLSAYYLLFQSLFSDAKAQLLLPPLLLRPTNNYRTLIILWRSQSVYITLVVVRIQYVLLLTRSWFVAASKYVFSVLLLLDFHSFIHSLQLCSVQCSIGRRILVVPQPCANQDSPFLCCKDHTVLVKRDYDY